MTGTQIQIFTLETKTKVLHIHHSEYNALGLSLNQIM